MAVSALNQLRESTRQRATGDDKYFRRMLNFFELRPPARLVAGLTQQFLFPVILPPESMRVEEPFTVEVTPTQGGGLYTEENGIVQRMISIRGHTGFKPRPLQGSGPWVLGAINPEKKSYTRNLNPVVADLLTGHAHFMYLQDAVFRTYADLKRDPSTSEETKLIFHIPKDDEHWLVVPQRFTLERSSSRPVHYSYSIDLIAVDAAKAVDADFSEDKTLLDAMKDAIRTVKGAIDLATGAVQDLTRIASEIENFIKDTAKILDAVATLINAAQDFVDGIVDLILAPLALIDSTLGIIDAALDAWDTLKEANEDIQNIDDTVLHKFDDIRDALELFGTHPEKFETDKQRETRKRKERSALLRDISAERQQEALDTPAPDSLAGWARLGTSITSGDMRSAVGETFQSILVANYRSAQIVPVGEGDTLPNLAARYLGDARRWDDIADTNNLQGPFTDPQAASDLQTTDERALPGALGTGDSILIPNFSKAAEDRPILVTLGVRPTESPLVHLLGRDIATVQTYQTGGQAATASAPRRPLFDLPVDVAGGSIDAQSVSGIANLTQGLLLRITTERGTDILYSRLGLGRTTGINQAAVDLEIVRFRIQECLEADGRIASVRSVVFEGIDGGTEAPEGLSLDTLSVDVELEVYGFAQRQNVRLEF